MLFNGGILLSLVLVVVSMFGFLLRPFFAWLASSLFASSALASDSLELGESLRNASAKRFAKEVGPSSKLQLRPAWGPRHLLPESKYVFRGAGRLSSWVGKLRFPVAGLYVRAWRLDSLQRVY
jgi:hypothetical protein